MYAESARDFADKVPRVLLRDSRSPAHPSRSRDRHGRGNGSGTAASPQAAWMPAGGGGGAPSKNAAVARAQRRRLRGGPAQEHGEDGDERLTRLETKALAAAVQACAQGLDEVEDATASIAEDLRLARAIFRSQARLLRESLAKAAEAKAAAKA